MSSRDEGIEEAMGKELTPIFEQLWRNSTLLHHRWQEYETLFGSGKGRLDILNKNCGSICGLIQRAFWSDTLLQLCRMTDPPRSAGKDNLTLALLGGLVKPEFKDAVETAFQKTKTDTAFAREWRNRVFAHSDLDLASEAPAKPLASADHQMVVSALESIGDCLNEIDRLYRDTTTYWQPIRPLDGAKTLLYILRAGNNARDKEIESMNNGNYDWQAPDRYMAPLPT